VELRQLRYFVTVAEELHFSHAAERLHMSQPPLTQQIQRLEAELGVRLFDRTTRRVRLTDAGRILLDDGARILTQVDRAVEAVRGAGRGDRGRLVLGFVSSAPYEILPVALDLYQRRFPEVQVKVAEMTSNAQVEALREGHIDVGLLRSPLESPEGVSIETVARELMVAVLPRAHRLAHKRRLGLAELAEEGFIVSPRSDGPGYFDALISACQRAGFSPAIVSEASQAPAIVGLVAAGIGISVLPASVIYLQLPGVVYKWLSPAPFELELAVAHRAETESRLVSNFLAVLREAVRAVPLRAFAAVAS
jgi:DNA-binding transcriptional LysR family regulator